MIPLKNNINIIERERERDSYGFSYYLYYLIQHFDMIPFREINNINIFEFRRIGSWR